MRRAISRTCVSRSIRGLPMGFRLFPTAPASMTGVRPFSDINKDFQPIRRGTEITPAEAQEIIKKDVTSNDVFLFMKGSPDAPQCGFSRQVCLILNHLEVDFASRNVLEDNTIREGVKLYANWPTFPQLYVKGELIGGYAFVCFS
jgi:monothiol glutaredoxin